MLVEDRRGRATESALRARKCWSRWIVTARCSTRQVPMPLVPSASSLHTAPVHRPQPSKVESSQSRRAGRPQRRRCRRAAPSSQRRRPQETAGPCWPLRHARAARAVLLLRRPQSWAGVAKASLTRDRAHAGARTAAKTPRAPSARRRRRISLRERGPRGPRSRSAPCFPPAGATSTRRASRAEGPLRRYAPMNIAASLRLEFPNRNSPKGGPSKQPIARAIDGLCAS